MSNRSTANKLAISCLGITLIAAGCGPKQPVAPVSGVVTLDGAPLEGARINTQPISQSDTTPGVGSFGVTDAEGRYTLELVSPAMPGAVIGEHVVRIKKQKLRYLAGREDAPIAERSTLPSEALDGSLRISVPPTGLDSADFDLKSK